MFNIIIREMQTKTTLRYYFTPIRMTNIKQTVTKVEGYIAKLEPSWIADGNVNWVTHSRETVW